MFFLHYYRKTCYCGTICNQIDVNVNFDRLRLQLIYTKDNITVIFEHKMRAFVFVCVSDLV